MAENTRTQTAMKDMEDRITARLETRFIELTANILQVCGHYVCICSLGIVAFHYTATSFGVDRYALWSRIKYTRSYSAIIPLCKIAYIPEADSSYECLAHFSIYSVKSSNC
ncbi:hypothetical protein VNO80_04151 [Phaseolus coccineus]|uniref:Uncharacterized protein n=1 Tax=Phaseolus coccineus TaxID=3886 RepID=A0AAN9NSX5_PHACN